MSRVRKFKSKARANGLREKISSGFYAINIAVSHLAIGFVFLWRLYRRYAAMRLFKRNKRKKKSGKAKSELTKRELEIIIISNKGLYAKEIASRLGISVHTVNNHKANIFRKIKVNNVVEMLQYARKHKIIPHE